MLLSNDFLLFLISSYSFIASSLFTLAVSSIIIAAVMLLVLMGLLASALSNFDVASFRSSSATLNFCLAFSSCSFKLSSVSSKDFSFPTAAWAFLTNLLKSSVIAIFFGWFETGSKNLTASLTTWSPIIVFSLSNVLSQVTIAAFTDRLRSDSAFVCPRVRADDNSRQTTCISIVRH